MERSELKPGMVILFGRAHGEQTLGEVVKVNPTTVKVKQLESRGTLKDHPIGTIWKVPFIFCYLQGTVPATKPALSPRAVLVNIINGRRHYGLPGEDAEMIYERLANQ